MCTFGVLGLSCASPGGPEAAGASHHRPRAQTCTFQGPGLQKHHQNSTKGPQKERRKNENCRRRGKKRNFGVSGVGVVQCKEVRCRVSGAGGKRVQINHTNTQHNTPHTTQHNTTQDNTTQHNTTHKKISDFLTCYQV